MRIKRARVVWKRKGRNVLIMTEKGIFLLNKKASAQWDSLGEGRDEMEVDADFKKALLEAGALEVFND
jgi:hypothetical protein